MSAWSRYSSVNSCRIARIWGLPRPVTSPDRQSTCYRGSIQTHVNNLRITRKWTLSCCWNFREKFSIARYFDLQPFWSPLNNAYYRKTWLSVANLKARSEASCQKHNVVASVGAKSFRAPKLGGQLSGHFSRKSWEDFTSKLRSSVIYWF